MELPTVSSAEINRMYRAAYRAFYFRPRYLLKRLTRMRSWEDIVCNLRALRSVMFTKSTVKPAVAKDDPEGAWPALAGAGSPATC
jgi:hypothetical protein